MLIYLQEIVDEFQLLREVCNRVGLRSKVVGDMTGWLGGSVLECSHGQQKTLGLSPGRATIFYLLHNIRKLLFDNVPEVNTLRSLYELLFNIKK